LARIINGTVGYSAVTHRLHYRPEDRGLFAILLTDCDCFSPRQPRFFDRHNKPMPPIDIPPGSLVNVAMTDDDWMDAVQVLELVEASPFAAVA
jgi:hypothetical protein